MHANDVPLHGLTKEEVRARREQGRTNTMPRRADGGLADILRRNVMTLFNLLNLCLAGLLLLSLIHIYAIIYEVDPPEGYHVLFTLDSYSIPICTVYERD